MLRLLTAGLEVFILIFGRTTVAGWVAQIRSAWMTYQDEEFKAACDAEYDRLRAEDEAFKKDRDES